MPKPIFIPDRELLLLLKEKISDTTGIKVTSKSDCASISQLILQNTKEYLSESTLYRFYFNMDGHVCYKNTLDKLARFCGNNNWDEFCKKIETSTDTMTRSGIFFAYNQKSLIQTCIANQELISLFQFFENMPEGLSDVVRRKLGLELYKGLLLNKNSNEPFYEMFSHSAFVRTLLFEELADPDFNIKDQFKLYKWYLKNSNKKNETAAFQEFIFAHVLLFRYHYKSGNKKEMKKKGELLYENKDITATSLKKIHAFPQSRWYAYRLWYSQIDNYRHYDTYKFELIELCRQAAVVNDTAISNIVFYNAFDVLVSLGEMECINDKLIPLFFSEKAAKRNVTSSVDLIMKRIEPNGLKRFFSQM